MIRLIYICLVFVFSFLLTTSAFAESNISKVNFELDLLIKVKGYTDKIEIKLLLPQDIPGRQKVSSIKYSIRPYKVYAIDGNKYAEFIIKSPQNNSKIIINMELQLFGYDLSKAPKISHGNVTNKKYITSEKYLESDNINIKNIADVIMGETEIEIVKNIYDFVLDYLSYEGYVPEEVGAEKSLAKREGDCTEFSDLFVAICRARNIPARVIEGYVTNYSESPKHNWVEVFLSDYGWVPFDLLFNKLKASSFDHLQNIYIYLSSKRTDKELSTYHYWYYHYWGDPVDIHETFKIAK